MTEDSKKTAKFVRKCSNCLSNFAAPSPICKRCNNCLGADKPCKQCNQTKPLSEFHINRACRDGRASICKQCSVEITKQKRNDPAQVAKWALYQWRHTIKRLYGLSETQWFAMLSRQGGCCAVCGINYRANGQRRFHVDHDHQTGKIRGLLCGACNTGIGQLQHSEEIMLKAIEYIRNTSLTTSSASEQASFQPSVPPSSEPNTR